jgi:hypothetical protein
MSRPREWETDQAGECVAGESGERPKANMLRISCCVFAAVQMVKPLTPALSHIGWGEGEVPLCGIRLFELGISWSSRQCWAEVSCKGRKPVRGPTLCQENKDLDVCSTKGELRGLGNTHLTLPPSLRYRRLLSPALPSTPWKGGRRLRLRDLTPMNGGVNERGRDGTAGDAAGIGRGYFFRQSHAPDCRTNCGWLPSPAGTVKRGSTTVSPESDQKSMAALATTEWFPTKWLPPGITPRKVYPIPTSTNGLSRNRTPAFAWTAGSVSSLVGPFQ